MKFDKVVLVPVIIFFILIILNNQFRWKYSIIFEKFLGLTLVIVYGLMNISYGIAFGILYMIYFMKYKH